VPADIEQFVGTWYRLGSASQCRMLETGDVSEQLGFGTVIGDEIWDQQSRARICLGPLTRSRYKEFLPGGSAYLELRALVRFLFGEEIGFDLRLILQKDDVPVSQLAEGDPLPLGWLTWLKSTPYYDRNPGDTILALN
jgi:type VI secretion system protein ImpH